MNQEGQAEICLQTVPMTLPLPFAHFELMSSRKLQLSGWTTASGCPDEQRTPWRGRSDRGTGTGWSAERNNEIAGDSEDEGALVYFIYFPSWRGGGQRAAPPDRRTRIQMGAWMTILLAQERKFLLEKSRLPASRRQSSPNGI